MIRPWHTAIAFGAAMLCTLPSAANARVLAVGPTRVLKVPSQAATIAGDGDVVRIDPGTYADCAIWNPSHLLIEAAGPGVVIAGKTCAEMGIFITRGNDITIRGITFADASVIWHNGAGIRANGRNLTVQRVQFIDDQNGILAAPVAGSVVRVLDSTFIGDGHCGADCAHGVYINRVARVEIAHSRFLGTREGHAIKSRAESTSVTDCTIEDGPAGTSSYAIDIPNGGDVLVADSRIEKGPHSENKATAIMIGAEGVKNPTRHLVFRDNLFINATGGPSTFVRNVTHVPAELVGNTFRGDPVTPLAN